jgi:hypothetical protein
MPARVRTILDIFAAARTFLPEFRRYRSENEIERTGPYWRTDSGHEGYGELSCYRHSRPRDGDLEPYQALAAACTTTIERALPAAVFTPRA